MAMLPFDYRAFVRHLKWANWLGLVSDERIDDAVGRILYAKFALGLFDDNRNIIPPTSIPNTAHKMLAREAVAQSLVLLKNESSLLPLSPDTPYILIAGSAAHNIGRQMGAWSVEWQGIDGNQSVVGTSVLEGIIDHVSSKTKVEYDLLGNFTLAGKKAPVGIAVKTRRSIKLVPVLIIFTLIAYNHYALRPTTFIAKCNAFKNLVACSP